MADNATSHFVKMGESALSDLVNISGERSRYTMSVPRKGPSGDAMDGGTAHRGAITMSGERNGPRFRPVTTLYQQNAASANDTGRGMRTVPSSLGNRDFWDRRNSDTGGQVIR